MTPVLWSGREALRLRQARAGALPHYVHVYVFHDEEFTAAVRQMTADEIEARPWRAVFVDWRAPLDITPAEQPIARCDDMAAAMAAAEKWIEEQQ
ncbi:hypothetical protein SEA_FUNSIZED_48 [Mycobacterium phage Funsized]|nr:hypothetical protein SEA_FUNSIZED_48 [Mycobacterium phage Funsized]